MYDANNSEKTLTSPRAGGALRGHRRPLHKGSDGNRSRTRARHTGSTGDEEARLCALSKTKHIERALEGRLERLDGVDLVVRRRGRAREVVDLCMEAVSACLVW